MRWKVQRCHISNLNGIQIPYDVYLLLVDLVFIEIEHREMAGTKMLYIEPQGIQVESVNVHGAKFVFGVY